MIEVLTEAGLKVTEHSIECLRAALDDLKANRHKYHPRTYRILEEPIVEEIELRQAEINKYLWQLDPQPDGVAVRDPEPDGPPADEVSEPIEVRDELPTEEEIAKLPRWARVAFAARCARRVLPLFKKHWPDAPEHRVETVAKAIRVAEYAASTANVYSVKAFATIADDITRDFIGTSAYPVAYTAAGAAMAAISSDKSALIVEHVTEATPVAGVQVHTIGRDWVDICQLAQLESWTDDTPVPPSVFGPLWPDGPPAGWPEDENPDRDLVLEIDLPDDATDADVKRYVELLVNKADDVYRAGGGNGLKISGLDITGEKLVAKPSPDSTQPSEELVGGTT